MENILLDKRKRNVKIVGEYIENFNSSNQLVHIHPFIFLKILVLAMQPSLVVFYKLTVVVLNMLPLNFSFQEENMAQKLMCGVCEYGHATLKGMGIVGIFHEFHDFEIQFQLATVWHQSYYNFCVFFYFRGVNMYAMLVGKLPFRSPRQGTKRRQKLLEQISGGLTESHDNEMAHISKGARDLVYKLLQPDPRRRIGLDEVMFHPWVTKEGAQSLHPFKSTPPDAATQSAVRKLYSFCILMEASVLHHCY